MQEVSCRDLGIEGLISVTSLVCRYVFMFALGAGPVPALILPELFADRIRAKALSVAMCVHWVRFGFTLWDVLCLDKIIWIVWILLKRFSINWVLKIVCKVFVNIVGLVPILIFGLPILVAAGSKFLSWINILVSIEEVGYWHPVYWICNCMLCRSPLCEKICIRDKRPVLGRDRSLAHGQHLDLALV